MKKTSQKGKYKSILATDTHQSVSRFEQFPSWGGFTMGFFMKGVEKGEIGEGQLKRVGYVPGQKYKSLQTESVILRKKFRKKGHGIHLYHHLIAHAKACGAERIYSSQTLNSFSRRMWSEKLAKLYKVVPVRKKKCEECGCDGKNCKLEPRGYYIQLKEKS